MKVRKRLCEYKGYIQDYREIKKQKTQFKNENEYRIRLTKYAHAYEDCKVCNDQVLYESFSGRGMVDNPYALFKELSGRKEFSHLVHIWVLDDLKTNQMTIENYKNIPNVRFVCYGSDEYIHALAEAKYLINNSTFPSYYIKKPDQIYINTWHGTPLKRMGYDMPDGVIQVANTIRNFISADYLISANERLTKMYLDAYRLDGILPGKIIEEGYPRNDLLMHTPKETILGILQQHGIILQEGKKIVLYAPTWKGVDFGNPKIDAEELIHVKTELESYIDTGSYQVLIKPHQIVYKYLNAQEGYRDVFIPSTIDTNELLSAVDILISDYSSIFLDFMALKRPILFYIPDLDDYRSTRGLYMEIDRLPGPALTDLKEVADHICSISQIYDKYKERYEELYQNICKYEDGSVSKRLVDIIWKGNKDFNVLQAVDQKKKVLIFRGNMKENRITHSFLNLLECLDYDILDVTVIAYGDSNDQSVKDKLSNLDPNVRVLWRTGTYAATIEEDSRKEFAERHGLYRRLIKKIYPYRVVEREFLRCCGRNDIFDHIVDFDGYNIFFSMVLLQGKNAKKSIWLHNDIKAELNRTVNGTKTVRQHLYFNISVYPLYDNLVSCGRSVMEVNRKNLATEETWDKFTYAKNTANERRMLSDLNDQNIVEMCVGGGKFLIQNVCESHSNLLKAQLISVPSADTVNFLTVGRMSSEKNHLALIRSFEKLHQEYPDTRLYILGDGPLRKKEEQEVRSLGLDECVFLPGNVVNPFVFMTRCHCFVLPSKHEEQPIVLLEARTAKMPIIVSDFSSVKDSLRPNGQIVVETTEEGILKGLQTFMAGKVPMDHEFDIRQYNKEAIKEFMDAIS